MKKIIFAFVLLVISSFLQANMIDVYVPNKSTAAGVSYFIIKRVIIKETEEGYYLVQDFYESGKKLTTPFLLKDKKQLTNYNYNQLDIESHFVQWYENGQKWEEGYYIKGKKHGVWYSWIEQGDKVITYNYQQGKLN